MKIHSIIGFCLLLALTLQSCSSSTGENDNLPIVGIDPERLNAEFIINEDPEVGSTNSHKNKDILILRLTNLGDSQIKFSPGYQKLFVQTDHGWREIENLMDNPNVEEILPTSREYRPGMAIFTIPSIPEMTEPKKVRIFIEGQNVDTGEKVGAYMDFTLLP